MKAKISRTFDQQTEAHTLIININLMREKIGVTRYEFDYLWNKSNEWLTNEQNSTIEHYNQAILNSNN